MEKRLIARQAVSELREMKKEGLLQPTKDIDLVWVLSAPGTYSSVSHDGIYAGRSADRERIDYGVELVKKITTLRMSSLDAAKEPEDITKDDILQFGPTLFYNGEDTTTKGVNYLQNEDLREAVDQSTFPLPKERIIVDHIDTIGTQAQIPGLMEFLKEHPEIKQVAVITHAGHSRRVARYVEKFLEDNPDYLQGNIRFLNAWMPETEHVVGTLLREVKKVEEYAQKGDLSKDPAF